jgi:HSP20 family protein
MRAPSDTLRSIDAKGPHMTVEKRQTVLDVWSLQDRGNRLFEEGMTLGRGREDMQAGQWTPAVDIFENAETIVLRADLPGVEPEDIDLKVEDGTLLLRGHRKPAASARPEDMRRAERPCGTFVRSFGLPSNVDQSGIRANQRNGVLEVFLPKKQESRARAIRVDGK